MRRVQLAFLVPILVVIGLFVGCPVGPAATEGAALGSSCSANLDCAAGLFCACGTCSSGDDTPPSCRVGLDANCPEEASECLGSCGDLTVVGTSECADGVETCAEGVLRESCPANTCWGEVAPGEICLNGELVCELGRSSSLGDCYTRDCSGAAADCKASCNETFTFLEECIGDVFVCEFGVLASNCGACEGERPSCVLECGAAALSQAVCDSDSAQWDCSFIANAFVDDQCPVDGGVTDAGMSTPDAGLGPCGVQDQCVLGCGTAPVATAICNAMNEWDCSFLLGGILNSTCTMDAGVVDASSSTDSGVSLDAGRTVDGGSIVDGGP
ncbi:MAG: hypothetical protein GY822_13460 [Deltaproteobacteria bacterium]|nr:hypothetical protein [Deltaproteobacteria bacterium]